MTKDEILKEGQKHMKGYKVFNSDWTCRGFKYEVGEKYHCDGEISCCKNGFHFCIKLADCFNYYEFNSNNKVAEIEASGDIDSKEDDTKHCASDIEIIREITWYEVLDMINEGKDNTGMCNTGNRNSGNSNSGNSNSGNWNSGNWNSGDCNSGDWNSGNSNSGDWNSGDCNSGDWNSGDCNIGNWNSGDCNSGNGNSGDCNSGNWNSGNSNSGDWNRTCFSNGCFNTESPKIFLFNKPSDWTYQDWLHSYARYILMSCPLNVLSWITEKYMTDEEKEQHPEYSVTGGFLKYIEKETGRQMWWNGLSSNDKETVMQLPNFDADIFFECTGIRV